MQQSMETIIRKRCFLGDGIVLDVMDLEEKSIEMATYGLWLLCAADEVVSKA